MFKKRIGGISKVLAGVAILFTCSGINAWAASALSGLTVSADWNGLQLGTVYEHSTPSSAVVGPSDAFFVFGPFNTAMDINVSASSNTVTLLGEYNDCSGTCNGGPFDSSPGVTFNGFVISVVNPPPGSAFTSVQIQSINWNNESPQVLFDATDIYVNMQGLDQIGPGSQIVLNYTFAPSYTAQIQQPINADRTSVFNVRRGVAPVKFTLTLNGVATCDLPPATIAVYRTGTGGNQQTDEAVYSGPADTGSNFRIDSCQYVYNLSASALGVGTYQVDIMINGQVVGSGFFQLK